MTGTILTCVAPRGARLSADLSAALTPELREIVRADTEAWIKRLRHVRYDGRTMRERFLYRQDSLWWFTELYLFRMRRLETAVATVLALEDALERHEPARLILDSADLVVRDAAHTFGRAKGVAVETTGAAVERQRHARSSYLSGLTATLSKLRPARPVFLPTHTAVAAFVYTALWTRAGDRPPSLVKQVLDALTARVGADQVQRVGIGPRRNLRRAVRAGRREAGAVTPIEQFAPPGVLSGALDLWRRRSDLAAQLTSGPDIRAAAEFHGCDLWPVLRRELEAVALRQWPWSARAMDDAASAIGAINPDVIVTYADASAWGRALVLEARRRDVPSVGVQHELVAHHGPAYSHAPDELAPSGTERGFPAPDRVLVFDQAAADHLADIGHFAPGQVVVTGNPRIDDLKAARLAPIVAMDRTAFRESLGVPADARLAVLVARAADLGDLLPALAAALADRPDIHMAIRTHPDDADTLARAFAGPAGRTTFIPPTVDLMRAIASADGLITRESTAAIDALSLGVPTLVLGAPGPLGPLVHAGIMLGATASGDVLPRLRALLLDAQVRRRLTRVVGASSHQDQQRGSARSADRVADAILAVRRRR